MMTTFRLRILVLALLVLALLACAKKSEPLPGDSVSDDGRVKLSPARLSTSPAEPRDAREPLGPIESRLFPPELVMEHQGELGIDEQQKSAILAETERGQSTMLRLQWELQGEKEKLVKLLDADRADEAKVQEIAARLMERETKLKSSHLGMLVRVKNLLTPDQQAKLRALRSAAPVPGGTLTTDAGTGGRGAEPQGTR